jgi:thiol-disulfide isomerase/thioredoxin
LEIYCTVLNSKQRKEKLNLESLSEILTSVNQSNLSLVLASTNNCSVCDAIEPVIQNIIKKFPKTNYNHIFIDSMVEASGEFMVFTVPTIILYAQGKEIHRQGRFISFEELEFQLSRWYEFFYEEKRL